MKNARKAFATVVALMFVFMTCAVAQGELTMAFDKKIIDVLEKLDCPVLISEVSEPVYGSYSIVESSGVELVQSWDIDGQTIELFKGDENGYLAILRSNDRVYCAQYINGFDAASQNEIMTIPEDAFSYTIITSASGIYVETRIAFFLDCQSIRLIFWTPDSDEPSYSSISSSDCILAKTIK